MVLENPILRARLVMKPAAKRSPCYISECLASLANLRPPAKLRPTNDYSKKMTRTDVLILDDWGPDLMTAAQRRDLMEIVDARYDNKATIITSQLPLEKWCDVIADPTFADAILDHLVCRSHRIALGGPSMRKVNSVPTPRKPSFSRILQEQRQASPA